MFQIKERFTTFLWKVLEMLEPDDLWDQVHLKYSERSLRMRISDKFYYLVRRWL